MDGGEHSTRIRLATPDDADVMTRMRWLMYVDTGRDEDTATRAIYDVNYADWLRKMIGKGDYIGWLAETPEGQVVGMVGLWVQEWQPSFITPNALQGYVLNVYVDQPYRNQGIARRMMETLLDECRRRELHRISLHASEYGRPLYDSLGFKATNEMRLEL